MSVYSSQIVAASRITAAAVTVPPSKVMILRCIDVVVDVFPSTAEFVLIGSDGQAMVVLSWVLTDSLHKQWQGRQVLNPGQTFTISCDLADVTISGYLLDAS